jgi:hypothetical protein
MPWWFLTLLCVPRSSNVFKAPDWMYVRPVKPWQLPDTGRIEVYALDGRYQLASPDASARYWIPGLELFLGVWEGTHEGRTGYWLRWWNARGELLLWSEERAEQENANGRKD